MQKKWIIAIVALWVVIVAAAGLGGYTMGKQAGLTQAQNIRTTFLTQRGLGGNGQGGQGGGFGGQGGGQTGGSGQNGGRQFNSGSFAVGQVKQVDGNTIQLSTANAVLTVKTDDKTQIQKMGQGSLSDLQPGTRISLQGTTGADGTFSAQMIQIGGPGGGPGGGNGRQAPHGTPAAGN